MTEQELKDLAEANATVRKFQISMYDVMHMLMGMDAAGLKNCGYKTHEEALMNTFKNTQAQIKKVWAAHIKKYPD